MDSVKDGLKSSSFNFENNDSAQPLKTPSGISYIIGRLQKYLERQICITISPLEIKIREYTALSVFNARGRLSNAQLAERTMVSPQAANELVKSMQKKGWIKRQPDPTHKRIVQISLTEEGMNMLQACDDLVARLEQQMMEDFSAQEQKTIQTQLRTMMRVLMDVH